MTYFTCVTLFLATRKDKENGINLDKDQTISRPRYKKCTEVLLMTSCSQEHSAVKLMQHTHYMKCTYLHWTIHIHTYMYTYTYTPNISTYTVKTLYLHIHTYCLYENIHLHVYSNPHYYIQYICAGITLHKKITNQHITDEWVIIKKWAELWI